MIECELSIDIWDRSNERDTFVCIKRVVKLPITPFPKLKVRVQRNEPTGDSSSAEEFSYLFRSITHKTGIFRVRDVLADEEGKVALSGTIVEQTSDAVELAAEFYCQFFGFKRFPY